LLNIYSLRKLQNFRDAYPEITYFYQWDIRTEREFKFPRQTFTFVGYTKQEKTPVETYITIRDMIPTTKTRIIYV